jgi:RNA polymerase sigma-70 factor (ECF subfamily)
VERLESDLGDGWHIECNVFQVMRSGGRQPLEGTHPRGSMTMTTASGSEQSFSAFVRKHESALYGLALRLCGNPADASDLLQDTFERALRSFAQLPPTANQRAWAAAILHNRFIDCCRRRKRTPIHEPMEDMHVPAVEEPAPQPWLDITAEQVRDALTQIGDEFRVVYELATSQNRSYKEIAAELRLPPATVGTRLIRARRKLRRILTPLVREAA